MLSLSAWLHRLIGSISKEERGMAAGRVSHSTPGKEERSKLWRAEAGDCTYIKIQNEHTIWGLRGVCTNGSNCFGKARGFPRGTRSVYLRDPIEGASPRSPHPWLQSETFDFYLLYIVCFCFRVLFWREQRKISSDKKIGNDWPRR